MLLKTATSLAFATACLTAVATLPAHAQMAAPGAPGTEVVTNGPQTNPGDMTPSWSARQNVIQSQHYDRLLETNRGFRQDEPYMGSSTSHRQMRSDSGR